MSAEDDIPRSLIPLYAAQAAAGDACIGRSVLRWSQKIKRLVRRTRTRSILDYGCGDAEAYTVEREHRKWGRIELTLYDPAVPRYASRPEGPFDGVICCDVLEHVPEDELPAFLDDVFGYARRWVFFSVCCRPAKRILPDGQNAHVTVRPIEWWEQLVMSHAPRGVLCKLREAE